MSAAEERIETKNQTAGPPNLVELEQQAGHNTITWRGVSAYITLALFFFILGFFPLWLKLHANNLQRSTAQHELRLTLIENYLARSTIQAQRGDYEPARQAANDFFALLRKQLDQSSVADLTKTQQVELQALLKQRDEIITLLANSNPAAAGRLSDLYVSYGKIMNNLLPK